MEQGRRMKTLVAGLALLVLAGMVGFAGFVSPAAAFQHAFADDPSCNFTVTANAPQNPTRAEVLCGNQSGSVRDWICTTSDESSGVYQCVTRDGLYNEQVETAGAEYFWYAFSDGLCNCTPDAAPQNPAFESGLEYGPQGDQ